MRESIQNQTEDEKEATLVALIARGEPAKDAANKAGVSERTVYRRKEDPEFMAKVAEFRGQMFASVLGILLKSSEYAANSLTYLLDNRDPNIRYKAAVKLIELGFKVRELEERGRRMENVNVELSPQVENVLSSSIPQLPEMESSPPVSEMEKE